MRHLPGMIVALVSFSLIALMVSGQPLLGGGAVAFAAETDGRPPGAYLSRLLKTTTVRPAEELRALWVVRDAMRSPQSVEQLVDFAQQARFHLLFVQVRGRGDAFYRSRLAPPGRELEYPLEDFDPLEYLLVLARSAGISVHAWLNVYYVWSDPDAEPPRGHVVNTHPEWALTDASGTAMFDRNVKWWIQDGLEGYYLAPDRREVRRHFVDVVSELLASYAIDGVHLDYVRYPSRAFGLDPEGRTRFALRWGVDPSRLAAERPMQTAALGAASVSVVDSIYTEQRAACIDSLVIAVRGVVGDLALSVAVVADPDVARYEKGQDWARWIHNRWIDFAVPMMYNDRPSEGLARMRVLHKTFGRDHVLPGLALHDGRSLFLQRHVAALREDHVTGFALFSYNVLAEMRFPVKLIQEAFFLDASEGAEGPESD